ncbi:hypothetical protein PMZ80_008761 [Knufia obscura]|uniref:C2H2-type domain-containing protein n=2 Tax=Knufia TaxID=430999 RepID=A0AAN8ESN8_9EURO|nr:hypothetical protein PMZ80_008761 [Knufia obscura]KAK5955275.1 hypothetical protein OHC33_003957 [Knufia fluminis]
MAEDHDSAKAPLRLSEPKVTYKLHLKGMPDDKESKRFQKMSVKGYKCPECGPTWPYLQQLLVHLNQTHRDYVFTGETVDMNRTVNGDVVIKISEARSSERSSERAFWLSWSGFRIVLYSEVNHSFLESFSAFHGSLIVLYLLAMLLVSAPE